MYLILSGFLIYGGLFSRPDIAKSKSGSLQTVAFLGPPGTNSQQATIDYFPASYDFIPVSSIHDVFLAVLKNETKLGMVPFENSIGGKVNQTMLDMANEPSIFVTGEIHLKISHNLARKPREKNTKNDDLSSIKKIYSHPQALAQCKNFLLATCPGAEKISVASTALAAQMANDNPESAALSNILACQKYGLEVLKADVQDQKNNTTRFFAIRNSPVESSDLNVFSNGYFTLISFGVENSPGKLEQCLAVFSSLNIGVITQQDFPNKQDTTNEYFLVQVDGHPNAEPLKSALRNLKLLAATQRIVGFFVGSTKLY